MLTLRTDLLVVGGGLGGVAAALTAAEHGINVIVTEQTDWLGGVLTSQAVPPDEHPWIEQFGCTRTYRRLRDDVRDYYRRHRPLVHSARRRPDLNPGDGRVSALCFEPRVGVTVIEAMLAPFVSSGRLRVLLEHRPTAAHTDGDRVSDVVLADARSGERASVAADWFVDATDTGELLPLCGVEHVMGAEARADTGEPHAAERADPLNMQPISAPARSRIINRRAEARNGNTWTTGTTTPSPTVRWWLGRWTTCSRVGVASVPATRHWRHCGS
ncbi:FAD-dependent oxidoreductase [Streptomyces sp. SBT349]|uniref:FAD-dependent oxidoreductase n=1 Tax=Streptomyces sp. SBT349 TaxID=1580539 RepID=UPI00099DABCE|nr:FAD-dependent oxidoreductase [Streptomyces sp. SBT349]